VSLVVSGGIPAFFLKRILASSATLRSTTLLSADDEEYPEYPEDEVEDELTDRELPEDEVLDELTDRELLTLERAMPMLLWVLLIFD